MKIFTAALVFASSFGFAEAANAGTEFDQNVTPDAIFGSGNTNGFFTTGRNDGVEVGLRAKIRFPSPVNPTTGNGDGTYNFAAGDACPGFGFAPFCQATPLWSFDWSVNTDYDFTTGKTVGDFIYEIGLDADPSKKTDFTVFDNISPSLIAPLFDHAFGFNSTPNSAGVEATDPIDYASLLAGYNVAQNSWNYEFFNTLGTSLASFDPALDGNYVIYLRVTDPATCKKVTESIIQVLVGDAPPLKGKVKVKGSKCKKSS